MATFLFPTMADAKQDITNGSSQSRVVLAQPRLGGFSSSSFGASSASKSSNPFGSVLRPSQLKPSSNPFLKVTAELTENKPAEKPAPTTTEERLAEVEAPKFMPLRSNVTSRSNPIATPAQPTPPAAESSGFVFGQNLSDRVVMKENVNNGDANLEHSSSNGTSDLLITSAVAAVNDNVTAVKENKDESTSSSEEAKEGLAASAAEYERSHARPLPPTNTFTTTGEEGEINVLQISCRLFAWESGSWRERGRGMLRLNDGAGSSARLVVRVAGSLRVVLNTKLWPDMVVERAGTKSLRVTACDAQQQIKLFLIMGAPGDIAQLHKALLSRIAFSKKTNTCNQNATSQEAAERLDNDYEEKPTEDAADFNDDNEGDKQSSESLAESKPSDERLEDNAKGEHDDLDNSNNEKQENSLKRKEPISEETSPKRQCPKIILQ